jgi:hypothetical protein
MLDYIAYLIVSMALGALIINTLRFFNIVGEKHANSSKCGGCTTGCEMEGLHQFRKNKPSNYDQHRIQL